jgi:hypothetical protein
MHYRKGPWRALSAFIMVCVAAMTFTACGGSNNAGTSASSQPSNAVTAPSPAESSENGTVLTPATTDDTLVSKKPDGQVVLCPGASAVQLKLTGDGNTDLNGVMLTASKFKDGYDVLFSDIIQLKGLVVNKRPVPTPNYDGSRITLLNKTYGGQITSIALCVKKS